MKTQNKIVCIVGESGSGKSYLCQAMQELGYTEVRSHTTRPSRGNDDHKICISQEEFDSIRKDLVAHTVFDGHEYGATRQQVDEAHLYVIDPDGIKELEQTYGSENLYVVYLDVNQYVRYCRIAEDRSTEEAYQRIVHDRTKFDALHNREINPKELHVFINNDYRDFQRNVMQLATLLERVYQ